MDVDITIDTVTGTIKIPKSVCGYFSLNMPFSTDISVLRTMFYDQSIVPTPLQVAHCGGTSLLHCALATQTVTPRERVLTQLRSHSKPDHSFCIISFAKFSQGSVWPLCIMSLLLVDDHK